MQIYAGMSPTGTDHCKELVWALSSSLNDLKYMNGYKKH